MKLGSALVVSLSLAFAGTLAGCQTVLDATGLKTADANDAKGDPTGAAKATKRAAEQKAGATADPHAPPAQSPPFNAPGPDLATREAAFAADKADSERLISEGRLTYEAAAKRQYRSAVQNGLAKTKADENYWEALISIYRNYDNRYVSWDDAKAFVAEAEALRAQQSR